MVVGGNRDDNNVVSEVTKQGARECKPAEERIGSAYFDFLLLLTYSSN